MDLTGLPISERPLPKASGLEGVVVADTRLSHVDGERGQLFIAGSRVEELALSDSCHFEAVVTRLLELAAGEPQAGVRERLAKSRVSAFARLQPCEHSLTLPDAMDALLAATAQGSRASDPLSVLGALPVYVAAGARLRAGQAPIAPDPTRLTAQDFMTMLGLPENLARARALDAYLVTVSDHGLNASTFAARVVASTGSDVMPCVVAGLAALKGPLHGGAPGPVLDMLDATASVEPRKWLENELAAGRRIMGMGHRIYRTRDPRALVFERALTRLEAEDQQKSGILARIAHARRVESAAEALLSERHPERPLRANVEFYTALLLEAIGIPRELFTATFAIGRCAGWLAHIEEQRRSGRLIRPAARYVGPLPD
ncbi:MAG TPA: citrate synthase [Polyangiaceae bacterium]|nr:citrate synthase [Polyangiaceae bacterium]